MSFWIFWAIFPLFSTVCGYIRSFIGHFWPFQAIFGYFRSFSVIFHVFTHFSSFFLIHANFRSFFHHSTVIRVTTPIIKHDPLFLSVPPLLPQMRLRLTNKLSLPSLFNFMLQILQLLRINTLQRRKNFLLIQNYAVRRPFPFVQIVFVGENLWIRHVHRDQNRVDVPLRANQVRVLKLIKSQVIEVFEEQFFHEFTVSFVG